MLSQEGQQQRFRISANCAGQVVNQGAHLFPVTMKSLLKEPHGNWFTQASSLDKPNSNEPMQNENSILQLKEKARQLYEKYSREFEEYSLKKNSSEEGWLDTAIRSGTMSDKLAAMIIRVQAAPLYRIGILNSLLRQASKIGRRESLMSIDALKELYAGCLLPSDRKLVSFHDQPLSATNLNDSHFVYWYFEDVVKSTYDEFVSILARSSHDSVVHTKKQIQKVVFQLLLDKPEKEQTLLSILVNKLGDPEKKVASNSSHYLTLLLKHHSGMKFVVAREVETFLHRSSVSPRSQYYAAIFLNQFMLSEEQPELSKKLITIYFSLFKRLTEGRKDVDSRMLSALLTGVSRAFPYSPLSQDDISDHLDTLYKLVHVASFNKSTQALQLIFQVLYAQNMVNDRFYRALYQQLSSPELSSSSRQSLFLNILFKAMKHDSSSPRVAAFLKRLLQVCMHQHPNFICGSLLLTSEILKSNQNMMTEMVSKPQKVSAERKLFSSQTLSQILAQMENDLNGSHIAPLTSKSKNSDHSASSGNSGHIFFQGKERIQANSKLANIANQSKQTNEQSHNDANGTSSSTLEEYDPRSRDPLYSHADSSVLFELVALSKHFHPSVSKWSSQILQSSFVEYRGDPLTDFGLHTFLDRVIYKNPKNLQKDTSKSGSAHSRDISIPKERLIPVNSPSFIQRDETSVPEDQLFFYKYFQLKDATHPNNKSKKKKSKGSDDDEDDFSEDEDAVGSDEDSGEDRMDIDATDEDEFDEFADDLDEHEVEKAVLSEFAKMEGKDLYEEEDELEDFSALDGSDSGQTKKKKRRYDYDDLEDAISEDDEADANEGGDDDEEADDGEGMDLFLASFGKGEEEDEFKVPSKQGKSTKSKQSKQSSSSTKTKGTKEASSSSSGKASNVFASVEEFQHLLQTSGMDPDEERESYRKKSNPKKRKMQNSSKGAPKSKRKKV